MTHSHRDALDGLTLVKWACAPHGMMTVALGRLSQGGGYLVLRDWALRQGSRSNHHPAADRDPSSHWAAAQERALEVEGQSGGDGGDDELDVAAVQVQQSRATQRTDTHVYEYHVLHSASYGVPVLYFRGNQLGAFFSFPRCFLQPPSLR